MLAVTVSGNLAAAPKEVFSNAAGKVYSVRFGCSTYKMENKQYVNDTVWCAGLVPEKKLKTILGRLQKGTYVVAHSPDATLKQYQANDGTTKCELELRFISVFEAGNLPKEAQMPPVPQYHQQVQGAQQQQQGWQAQPQPAQYPPQASAQQQQSFPPM